MSCSFELEEKMKLGGRQTKIHFISCIPFASTVLEQFSKQHLIKKRVASLLVEGRQRIWKEESVNLGRTLSAGAQGAW